MTAALRHQLPSRPRAVDPAAAVVGAAVQRARQRKGVPQRAFAAELGLSAGTVAQIERGQIAVPPGRVADIAAVLGLDPDELRAPAHIAATDEERAHLAAIRRLTPADRGALLDLARTTGRGP